MGHMRRARSLISRSFQLQDSFPKVRLAVFKIMHIVPRYKYRIAIYISMARLGTPGKVMCRSRYEVAKRYQHSGSGRFKGRIVDSIAQARTGAQTRTS